MKVIQSVSNFGKSVFSTIKNGIKSCWSSLKLAVGPSPSRRTISAPPQRPMGSSTLEARIREEGTGNIGSTKSRDNLLLDLRTTIAGLEAEAAQKRSQPPQE